MIRHSRKKIKNTQRQSTCAARGEISIGIFGSNSAKNQIDLSEWYNRRIPESINRATCTVVWKTGCKTDGGCSRNI